MTSVESAQIGELTSELREFRAEFRVVKTKLLGDDETENAQGRIPRVEAAIAEQNVRIGRIERETWLARGGVVLLVVIGAIVEFVYHITGIVRH